jgi:phospholipid/cholesterol/gamma-HCH transport system substrate-binding protein
VNRLILIQLAMFVAIAIGCTVFVANNVLGRDPLAEPTRVTVKMANAGGLTPTSQVTYRGTPVGVVDSVRLDPASEHVLIDVTIDPGRRIPANSAVRVSMDAPVAIQHLDFRPVSDTPPFLENGGVIEARGDDTRPLPLETLLRHATELVEGVDPADLAAVSEALAVGLGGTAPQLQQALDNTAALATLLAERQPQITNLVTNGPPLLESANSLPELARSMRELTGDIRAQEPVLRDMLDTTPRTIATLTTLLDENHQDISTLLGNLVTTTQIASDRIPALHALLSAVPDAIGKIASIVHGDVAEFYLLLAQGPVCYYGTPRRTPVDVAPREPMLGWHCPPEANLSQRGAANAPRPGPRPPAGAAPGQPASPAGPAFPPEQSQISGPRSWSAILLQGIQ